MFCFAGEHRELKKPHKTKKSADFSADFYETASGCHHRTARYRCVADAAGNIYQ